MDTYRLFALAALLVGLGGCAETAGDRFDELRERTQQDCGVLELSQTPDCDDALLTEAVGCLTEALEACEPARLELIYRTVEGDPIVDGLFVVESALDDGGCGLRTFHDSREDEFGSQEVTEQTCRDVELVQVAECLHARTVDCVAGR